MGSHSLKPSHSHAPIVQDVRHGIADKKLQRTPLVTHILVQDPHGETAEAAAGGTYQHTVPQRVLTVQPGAACVMQLCVRQTWQEGAVDCPRRAGLQETVPARISVIHELF